MNRESSHDDIRHRPRMNERIRVKQVRVIDSNGKMIGILSIEEALESAYAMGLDLVEIAPTENPPVCKIVDSGKFLYELKKKEKDAKKHQVGVHLKEVRFTARIGENDYQVKLKHIRGFLEDGNRVKVSLRFRGREVTRKESGEVLMQRVIEDTKDVGKVEFGPKQEGLFITLQLVPFGKKSK